MTNNLENATIFIFKLLGAITPYYGVGIAAIIFIAMSVHAIYCLIRKRNSEALDELASGMQFFCTIYLVCVVAYLKFNKCDISSLTFPFNIPIWFLVLCIVISLFLRRMVKPKMI